MPVRPQHEKPLEKTRKAYKPPRIVAYDQAELLEQIGPAVACARWDTGGAASSEEPKLDDGREEPW